MSTTVVVQEGQQDLQFLNSQGLKLQVLRIVRQNSRSTSNVVFVVDQPQPSNTIQWNSNQFALNFTTNAPQQGEEVQLNGEWQPCTSGQAYALDQSGMWQSNGSGTNGIGVLNQAGFPVFVVIGSQLRGQWRPIFVSTQLMPNQLTSFQPTQQIKLYYDNNSSAGTGAPSNPGQSITFDMSGNPSQFFKYSAQGGQWSNQSGPFQ